MQSMLFPLFAIESKLLRAFRLQIYCLKISCEGDSEFPWWYLANSVNCADCKIFAMACSHKICLFLSTKLGPDQGVPYVCLSPWNHMCFDVSHPFCAWVVWSLPLFSCRAMICKFLPDSLTKLLAPLRDASLREYKPMCYKMESRYDVGILMLSVRALPKFSLIVSWNLHYLLSIG